MKTAFSYVRFSTPEQAKGDSLRRQIKAGHEWCKANGFHYSDETFFDKGKSGFKGEHLQEKGELKRFIGLVEKGQIPSGSVLLVENFDRLSRLKPVESYTMFLNLISAGVGVVFTLSYDKRIITTDSLNKEPHILQMILGECIRAHGESARKSLLVSESKQNKRKRISGGEILKHNAVPKYFSWNPNNQRYEHNEKTKLIEGLVNDYMAGKSLYKIAGEFNAAGIKSIKTGGNWSPRSVKCILSSKCLIGEYLGNSKFLPPIITVERFNRLQVLLKQNQTDRGKEADLCNIFKGIAFCQCGQRMNVLSQSFNYTTKKKKPRVYRYIRCCSVAHGNPCEFKYCVPLEQIEEEFFVECLMRDPRKLLQTEDKEGETLRQQQTAAQLSVAKYSKQITMLVELMETMDAPELKAKLSKLISGRDTAKAELDAVNLQLIASESKPEGFDDLQAIVQSFHKSLDAGIDDTESKAEVDYAQAVKEVQAILTDNPTRQKLRTLIPQLIQKIVINSKDNQFHVLNHSGKTVYESMTLA
jgi:DNA invertase Pin-like site-specific DNA recombinase